MFVFEFLSWLLRFLGFEVHEIGRRGLDRYLTRWSLWGSRWAPGRKLFLHCFHRGDAEAYDHDHPWPFWSLILWGGYWEHTPAGKRWYGALSLLRRPAAWRHRVELPEGRRCWTLVWTGPRSRTWGFWCPAGWIPWKQHEASQLAGGTGCDGAVRAGPLPSHPRAG
jgi:hypothetical protein